MWWVRMLLLVVHTCKEKTPSVLIVWSIALARRRGPTEPVFSNCYLGPILPMDKRLPFSTGSPKVPYTDANPAKEAEWLRWFGQLNSGKSEVEN